MATNAQIQSILDYFGSSSSIYRKIVFGTATDAEISYALTQIPQMKVDVSAAGTTLGYSYVDPVYIVPSQADDIISSVNSNNGFSTLGGNTVSGGGNNTNYNVSFGRDPVTGQAYIEAGKNTLGQTIMAVADRVALGVCGVNIGAKLGKAIDQTLYDLNPAWWDEHLPALNPQTWATLAGENELGQSFIRTLFGIKDDGTVTGYIDEKIFAYMYQMLRDLGVFGDGSDTATIPSELESHYFTPPPYPNPLTYTVSDVIDADVTQTTRPRRCEVNTKNSTVYAVKWQYTNGYTEIALISDKSFTCKYWNGSTNYRIINNDDSRGKDGLTVYITYLSNPSINCIPNIAPTIIGASTTSQAFWNCLYTIINGTTTPGGGVDGITNIDGATQYPPTNITGTTLDDVLQQLKQEYPDLFNDSITDTVLQPDGTTQTITYVPVPWQISNPIDVTQTSPITQENPTTDTKINPDTAPEIITHPQDETQPFDDTTTPPPTTTTPDTGEGTTDPIVLPTGQATSLWAIYNPTQSELNSFGGWLWSSNFVEQLKKLFNDPMQAIIGVHKVFATPSTGGNRTIVCGYLDSGVSSKIVTSQYSKVDCGSVSLQEYFGNVFDYSPFTTVKIFLPFIGIVPLDVSYIMRSTISVEYTVDVLTGACLANVSVNRDGCGGVIFTYGGSCICSYPISSGSYTGIVSGALSLLAGVAGTVASGGAALPAVMGTLSGIGRMKTDVQHSGQFSGPAGAMGGKKPYLIISRPQTRVAGSVENYEGKPSNATIRIGDCVGFTRITQAHLMIPNAYNDEISEIENILKMGVIV